MHYKATRLRLLPNQAQTDLLTQQAGSCRFIYNHFLALQKERYRQRKEFNDPSIKFLSYVECAKWLTGLKQTAELSWLQSVYISSLQQTLMDLNKGIVNWLRKQSNFPQFKKKGKSRDSFRLPIFPGRYLKQSERKVWVPKIGWMRYRNSTPITGEIRSATVTRDGDHWYIAILTQHPDSVDQHPSPSAVGIDLGVKHFATLSTGEHIDLPDLRKLEKRIVSLQQRLSHKQRGSNNRKKAQAKLTVAYRKLRNIRHDFLHKASSTIAKNHSYVVLEDLKVKSMMASASGTLDNPGRNVRAKTGLNRSIARQSWGLFRVMLTYKLNVLNGELRVVDPRYTSVTCPQCLTQDRRNRRSQAEFKCITCGHSANADSNAAINILRLGFLGRSVAA